LNKLFEDRLKQYILLLLLAVLVFFVFKSLRLFIPGILGAVTLYILSRENYFQMLYVRKWKPKTAALIYVLYFLLLLGVPFFFAYSIISPKIDLLMANPQATVEQIKKVVTSVEGKIGWKIMTQSKLEGQLTSLVGKIPGLLNETANVVTNLAIMLFLLYHMLTNAKALEKKLFKLIPLRPDNINLLAREGKTIIKANAIGIPLISLIQGITAAIGYAIFQVPEWYIWGFLTAIFAFMPIVGTMLVWVPLVIYMYTIGSTVSATSLLLYSLIVTGNVDYLARLTIMKKLGDVHPVLTVLGIIVGFELFGFIGLIFGPVLLNYMIVLYRIYISEFKAEEEPPAQINST
jgi:predicted PurR-regulated permease PerM